jgi:hypothetical protein
MAKNAIPSNPMHETATRENAIISKRLSRMLGLSLHAWEDIMVASLALAGVIALIIGIATFSVVRLQRVEIAESNEALEKYKVEAGSAIESTRAEAARANESSERLKNETARLQSENLALQTVLLPRRIALSSLSAPENADRWFAPMAEFKTVSFAVQPVNDAEARSLAADITLAMAFVGVRASIDDGMVKYNPTNTGEGVSVSFPTGDPLLEKAGNALADALTMAGLGVGDMPVFRRGGIPPDPRDIASGLVNPIHKGVVVSVGQRPVSHTVAWLNRERSKATGNPAAVKTDLK